MPLSPEHQKKKKKNYLLLSLLVGFVLLVFAVTVIKMSLVTR